MQNCRKCLCTKGFQPPKTLKKRNTPSLWVGRPHTNFLGFFAIWFPCSHPCEAQAGRHLAPQATPISPSKHPVFTHQNTPSTPINTGVTLILHCPSSAPKPRQKKLFYILTPKNPIYTNPKNFPDPVFAISFFLTKIPYQYITYQ